MSGGGGGGHSTNTVQQADPWSGVQPFLRDIYARAQQASYQTPQEPYQGPFMAPASPWQHVGINLGLQQASNMQGLGQSTQNLGQRTLAGDFLQSPYVRQAAEGTIRPLLNTVREQVMPGLGQAAASAGAFGDTGHRAQEARILRDTNQVVADTVANMLNERFGEERKLQMLAPGLLQQGVEMNLLPAQLMLSLGEQQRALAQDQINEQLMLFQEQQEAPWRALMPYADILGGLGSVGGSLNASTIGSGQSRLGGALQGALAGGLGGYAFANAFPATAGAVGGPWGAALLGAALLGGLGLFR
jgi:hypothetical protein